MTGLRNSDILVQIRTPIQAKSRARQLGVDSAQVGRFKVQVPRSSRIAEPILAVFVENLPANATVEEIRAVFESVGHLKQIDLPPARGRHYKFGFVHYFDRDAVSRAIAELDGVRIRNQPLAVRPFIPKVS